MAEKTIDYIKLPDGETYKIGGGSGFNLFDTKISDHILEGEEALGWALQGTYVTKTEYPDAYNRILNKYNDANNTIEPLAQMYKTVGSPTYSSIDGNLSGFTTTAYGYMDIAVPKNNTLNIETEFQLKLLGAYTVISHKNTSNFIATTADGYITFSVTMSDSSVVTATGTKALSVNKKYKAVFERTATEFKLSVYNGETLVDSISATVDSSLNIGTDSYTTYYIGVNKSVGVVFNGYINITKTAFYIGNSYYPCTINAYVNSNGIKIYDTYNKTYIDSIYTNTGIADYYGIDLVNERIFLPRNDKFVQLTGDTSKVNKTIEAGLPNIVATWQGGRSSGSASFVDPTGAIAKGDGFDSYSTGTADLYNMTFDASRSSSVYGKSSTVQPPSSLKLLYYCVGNTKVESAVSNVTEITTSENDTLPLFYSFYSQEDMTTTGAYVNASLGSWLSGNVYTTAYNELVKKLGTDNVKANTDTYTDYDFVVNQDDITFRLPLKNCNEDLADWENAVTITAPYTASENGYITGYTATQGDVYYCVNGVRVGISSGTGTWASRGNIQVLIKKGDVFTIEGNVTDFKIFKFIPAIGNGNLYYKVANAVTNLEILDAGKVMNALNTVVPDNASLISSYGMPSTNSINLTLGATGTQYTAPANGWVIVELNSSKLAELSINAYCGSSYISYTTFNPWDSNYPLRVSAPVTKGSKFQVWYTNLVTKNRFQFIYAQGEV